jgi:hypothetical protein
MSLINSFIKDELTHPKKYAPIEKGFFVACVLIAFCVLTVPFYILQKRILRS